MSEKKEYITKDAVFDLLHGEDELILFARSYKENGSAGERLCNAITRIPAADVEPVVRGGWQKVYENTTFGAMYRCSTCGETTFNVENYKYCPKCGAHMERSGK